MKKVDVTMIAIAIQTVRQISADHSRTLDVKPHASSEQFRAAARTATAQLNGFGFTVRDDYRGAAISFGGIRATSTANIGRAMTNWLRAAEAKIGAAA